MLYMFLVHPISKFGMIVSLFIILIRVFRNPPECISMINSQVRLVEREKQLINFFVEFICIK